MGWKQVGPHEYLTSYWTDPVTGKKQMNSLGRRSPATEKKKADFDRGRAEVDKAAAEMKQELEPLIRVGRALRIGRLEPIAGDVLRELATNELLGPKLMVIGSAAIPLYEASAGAMLPMAIMSRGDLDLLSSADSRRETLEELLQVILRADKSFALVEDPVPSLRNARGFRVDLHTRQSLVRSIDQLDGASEEQLSVLHSLLDLEPVSAVTIAQDGAPVGMTGMDPRAVAITKYALATLDPDRDGAAPRHAKDQAFAVGRLVMRFGSRPFEDEHLAAFPAFAESIETGDPGIAETIGRCLRP
ncbi:MULTISPECIES: GSU2403 family nucleotidyltransferase fold protein [unclassified Bradyrhizobium]|uniref:GSU2403 family nucleotidyltransferase fold protein n=1 Tax=unclassified Bradyrhizobium TaxID=2631580 RepID=UPI002FF00B4F